MNNAEETGHSQPRAEQTLPRVGTLGSEPADSAQPVLPPTASMSSSLNEKLHSPILISDGLYLAAPRAREVELPSAELAAPVAAQLPQPVDNVHQRITNCVVELKRLQADSISVVIKPDTATELSLRLQMQDGLVDVQAQFKRGDLAGLTAHWEQLQQHLSSQGIRLGALQPESQPNLTGQHRFDNFPRGNDETRGQPRRSEPRASSRPQTSGSPTTNPSKLPTAPGSRRRWESWA